MSASVVGSGLFGTDHIYRAGGVKRWTNHMIRAALSSPGRPVVPKGHCSAHVVVVVALCWLLAGQFSCTLSLAVAGLAAWRGVARWFGVIVLYRMWLHSSCPSCLRTWASSRGGSVARLAAQTSLQFVFEPLDQSGETKTTTEMP